MTTIVNLLHDEEVKYLSGIHPLYIAAKSLAVLIAMGLPYLLIVFSIYLLSTPTMFFPQGFLPNGIPFFVNLLFMILSFALSLYVYLYYRSYEYLITNRRLLTRKGVIARSIKAADISLIQNVSLNQSVFERLLNIGNITVESAGTKGALTFPYVRNPEKFILTLEQLRTQRFDSIRARSNQSSEQFTPYKPYP